MIIAKYNHNNPPIFIVGAPRSGTTLLTAMLSSHRRISAGQETHFFSRLNERVLQGAVSDTEWPYIATKLVSSLELSGEKVIELYGLNEKDIFIYLEERTPSIQAMLESLTQTYALCNSKERWVEKTPNHILHLDRIRVLYPISPIIRIVRDPRDSSISISEKLPWASNSIIANCYMWEEWFRKSKEFFENDRNSYTLKYEELVLDTEFTLKKICKFIGEEFDGNMLSHHKSNIGVISVNEPWKNMVSKEVYKDKIQIWEEELTTDLKNITSMICHSSIDYLKYNKSIHPSSLITVYPLDRKCIELNEQYLLALSRNKILSIAYSDDYKKYPMVYGGIPNMGRVRSRKILNAIIFCAKLFIIRLNGKRIRYLKNIESNGIAEKICLKILKMLGQREEVIVKSS